MTITSLFILINVICAVLAAGHLVRRPDRVLRDPRNARPRFDHRADARVRVAEFGSQSVAAQTRLSVCVAPLDNAGVAIELTGVGDVEPVQIGIDDVRSLRVWLRGRPVAVLSGDAIEPSSALRPLSHMIAGWELELTTRDGDLVRCYGEELSSATEQDLARLRRVLAVRVRAEAEVRPLVAISVRSLGAPKWQPVAL
jgi:hypothetical protein